MTKNHSDRKIRTIEPGISQFIQDRNLVIMRDKRTRKPLSVSYTEDGLKGTSNKYARLTYYKNAYLRHKLNENGDWEPYITGDTSKNPNIIVEKFVPMNHNNPKLQAFEFRWIDKAVRMCYHVAGEEEPKKVHNPTNLVKVGYEKIKHLSSHLNLKRSA